MSHNGVVLSSLTIVGQVQLSTSHTVSLDLPQAIVSSVAPGSANKILALIETEETKYQTSLNEAYQEMSEKTFKGLRRALPMTRAKLDWDRVCLFCLLLLFTLIYVLERYSDTN